jgi:hypothetical protein
MNSKGNVSGTPITFSAYLTCLLALAGWIDFTRWRDAVAHPVGSTAPEVRAADAAPPPQRDPEPSCGINSDDRAGRHASPSVSLTLSRKPTAR